jgi:ABC-2 type transport system permease protein
MKSMFAFVERDIRLAAAYPLSFFMPFLSIAITVAGFAFLSKLIDPHVKLEPSAQHLDYFTYVVLNFAFMMLLNRALQAASSAVRRDQLAGTLEPIVAKTTSLPLMVFGSSLWPMTFAAIQAVAYIGIGIAFGMQFGHVDIPGFAVTLLVSLACMTAIGILAAAAVMRYRQTPPSSFLVGGAAALLTGVLFPVALLPAPLQVLAWLMPLTHALHGIRATLAGAPFEAVAGDVVWLAIASGMLLPVALYVFHAALVKVKIDGTLASY